MNPVEDKDSDAAKKYFNDLLDRLNNNLVQIRDGLLKDNKHMEVPAVELDRLALQQVSRPALVRTVDFVYNNRQYWKNATSLQLNKGDDENTTLKSFENLAVVLQKVHDGLNKDNKRVQAVLASVLKAATEKQGKYGSNDYINYIQIILEIIF